MKRLTREWLGKADEDHSVAAGLMRRRKVPCNSVCFHCQQSAEKYLKAVLQEGGVRFGKVHDLEELARFVSRIAPGIALLTDDLKLLSDYAVKYRYPGFDATRRQARAAVVAAKRVRAVALGILPSR